MRLRSCLPPSGFDARELGAPFARVVRAVAVQRPRSAPWPAPAPAHGRDLVDEWDQLGDVVAVAAGERAGKRRAAPGGDYVMLGAAPRAVDGAGAGLFAPQTPARASCRSPPATSRSAR